MSPAPCSKALNKEVEMNIIDRLIGTRYVYGTGVNKTVIKETEMFFADGDTVRISGHWTFMLGITYNVTYSGEANPYTLDSISVHAG